MKEIIHIHIGQCGTTIGSNFWTSISEEHGLDLSGHPTTSSPYQLSRLTSCFNESISSHYTPRALFIDLDPITLDSVRSNPFTKSIKPENIISGQYGTRNNWVKGHYTEGAELMDSVLDAVRKEMEACECFQGFQITHSLGGGTGSGMGTLLLDKFREEYVEKVVTNFSVFPSEKVSDTVVEPYNAVLSILHLNEYADAVVVVDNEALYEICRRELGIKISGYEDLNYLVSAVMSGVSSCYRFPVEGVNDWEKLVKNLNPLTRTHYFIVGLAPLISKDQSYLLDEACHLTDKIYSSSNSICDCDSNSGKYLASVAQYRGEISDKDIDDQILTQRNTNSNNLTELFPNNLKTSKCEIPLKNTRVSSTSISNSTAVIKILKRISQKFEKLFRHKSFLLPFLNEGMDDMEFTEAESSLCDLITEYEDLQDSEDSLKNEYENDDSF